MNMAERYRQKLENAEIKKRSQAESISVSEDSNVIDIRTKFKELETSTLSKIKKTPYWSDYPQKRQENMISKYFDSKTKKEGTSFTGEEKIQFVKNVLEAIR